MLCDCDAQVRCVAWGGNKRFVCATGRCRFSALNAIQVPGYLRILPSLTESADESVIVRFEAVLHPSDRTTHVMATASTYTHESVLSVLEDQRFSPKWYVAKAAYIYPMESYRMLLEALSRTVNPRVQVEEIPTFFFNSLRGAIDIVEQHERNVDGDQSQSADPDDAVYAQLRSFQKKGVDFIIARGGRGMIADDMGLGKTIQAIALAHHYRDEWPVLIVCPVSLMENWAKEITRFCSIPSGRIAILRAKSNSVTDMHSVVIVPYTQLRKIGNVAFKVVILDESHFIKSIDAVRTKEALRWCLSAQRVILLSGTPALSKPIELYPQLQAIVPPSILPSMRQFAARYCNAHMTPFVPLCTKGHSNMSELHVLLQHFMIRRTKTELGPELPSKSRQRLFMYVTPKEREALEKDVIALRNSMSADGSFVSSRSLNAFELKSATARAKIPAVQDYVRDTVEKVASAGEKIIIFAHHQHMMEAIREAVQSARPKQPLDYITIAGETPASEREKLTSHFRESPNCHVAVLSMHSCGVGHNLTCASTVVFAELDWNPTTHLQCEDRVHRMGQSSPCFIYYLFAEGTADGVIWPLLDTKLTVTSALLEDKSNPQARAAFGVGGGGAALGAAAAAAAAAALESGGSGGAWTAEAETRRVHRTDLSPALGSQERRQATLKGFVTSQESRTPPDPRPAADPEAQAEAEAPPPLLLDMAALRERREAMKPAAAAISPPVKAPQRQATLAESVTVRQRGSDTGTSVGQRTTTFRVSYAPNVSAGPTAPILSGATSTPPSSRPLRSPFIVRPQQPQEEQRRSTESSVTTAPRLSSTTSPNAVASKINTTSETVRLVVAPRSEEIRNYNARRTLFTLPEKRPRQEGE